MGNKYARIFWFGLALILVGLGMPARSLAQGQAPDVNLHQCANDSDGSNFTCADGSNLGWKNSQINGNNGSYYLGDFYPNRQVFSNLTAGNQYCFAVGFDYSKGGLPAVDYLGSYDASIPADPTLDTPFTLGIDVPDTTPIPAEPALAGVGTIGGNTFINPTAQVSGDLTLWGGTFTPGSLVYSNPGTGDLDVDFQQSLEYCFTATGPDAVMAFGAHIAWPFEWGHVDRPTGSPYHVSNGSRNGQFTAPRTSETDLVAISPTNVVLSHRNIGRTEQQIQDSAVSAPSPTAITLSAVAVPAGQRTIAYLLGSLMLGLSVVSVVVSRPDKVWRRR
ncbi:MAG: hypothetical protein KDE59_31740 [Anaerolineales bacterium]|nr:hypothetical protein [Anaerolineales bacterium]MCB0007268.1 hypothetical protein [Anaerolineales bacterium]